MSMWNSPCAQGPLANELLQRRWEDVPLPANQTELAKYLQRRRLNGKKVSTIGVDAEILGRFGSHLNKKRFISAGEPEFEGYFAKMMEEEYAPTTRYHHWVVIRTFYKALHKSKDPKCFGSFSVARAVAPRLNASDLITPEEMTRILALFVGEPSETGALNMLYGPGLRAGELFGLNYESPRTELGELHLNVPSGKTGSRDIIVFAPADDPLRDVMAAHSSKTRGDPLFTYQTRDGRRRRIDQGWLQTVMERIRRAKVLDKEIWPHLLRHSAASNFARMGCHEADMRAYFGWAVDSEMPSYYAHLAQTQHQDGWRRAHGVAPPANPPPAGLQVPVCGKCHHKNRIGAVLCSKCNRALHPDAVEALKRQEEQRLNDLALDLFERFKFAQSGREIPLAFSGSNEVRATP